MTLRRYAFALAAALASAPCLAGPSLDALNNCIADSTNGRERKELAVWIFTAMSVHPSMQAVTNISAASRDQATQSAARIMTRVFAESCAGPAAAAIKAEGPQSLNAAGQMLGRLAVQELMTNQDVAASLGAVTRYLDQQKFEQAMRAAAK